MAENSKPLSDRIALVTGASRGIGAATALALAQAGAHVVAVARTVGGLEELDDKIKAAGGSATLVPLDVKDSDGIARLALALNERYQRLDVLVGNAGILGPLSPLCSCRAERLGQSDCGQCHRQLAIDPLHGRASPALAGRPSCLSDVRRRAHGTRLLGSLRGLQGRTGSSGAHLCGGMRDHASARQFVRARADAHANVCQRFPGHRSAHAANAGGRREGNPAAMPAGMRRDRQTLQFP